MTRMVSYLGYPGNAVLQRAADMASLTCWMMASITLIGLNMLFIPWSRMTGKSLAIEYPLMIPWFLITFILLGALPGRRIKKMLQQTDIESWSLPGAYYKVLPLPIEDASRVILNYWMIVLPVAFIVHHHLIKEFDGAWIVRPWVKGVVIFLVIVFAGQAVLERLKYELVKPGQ